jgi:DNA-binding PucR family transcriptional regulator
VAGGTDTPHDENEVRGALIGVAAVLRDGLQPLRARVDAAILDAVPALAGDPDVRLALARSTEANLADLLALLADPDLPVDVGVAPEALNLATTLVRRGVDPGDLVHSYLVGQNEMWRVWMEEIAGRLHAAPDLVAALERSSVRIFSRADFLVAQLMRHVDRERERWLGGALARRSQIVRSLLDGDDPGIAEASRLLGYDLDRCVLAAVLWERGGPEGAGAPSDGLVAQAAALARAAGATRAFTFAPSETSLWAWVATAEPPDLDVVRARLAETLPDGQAVALGVPGHGLGGFRIGHEEALAARRLAELGDAVGVIRYDQVEAVSLLSADLDRLARFVCRTLGELTAGDESTTRLRETLLAWLTEGGNARRAAERVHAHKNTVLYRLQRAQEILGRPLDDDRGDLELALTAMQWLGPKAVGAAA